jgi:hypothetical protein
MPLSLPDGPQLDLFGQPVVPVSPSVKPDNDAATLTSATSGRRSMVSSASVALQQSLESKLRALMDGAGSLEYTLTWKHWAIRSGLRICALRASGHPTSGNDCTGWPTPDAQGMNVNAAVDKHLARVAELKAQKINGNGAGLPLGIVAQMAGWARPASRDWKHGQASQETMARNSRPLNEQAVNLAGWGTPRSVEAGHSTGNPARAADTKARLEDQVYLAGWVSPTAQDGNRGSQAARPWDTGVPLSQQVALAWWSTPRSEKWGSPDSHGNTLMWSIAEMEKPGALNPEHSRWLMGFPPAWGSCAPTAMRLSRKSPHSS